jgi:hypothetical protein
MIMSGAAFLLATFLMSGALTTSMGAADREAGFPEGRGAPPAIELPSLLDWTRHADPGVRYFSGTATYRKEFPISGSGPVLLDLGVVREIAVVRVNGREAGVRWKEPYRIDIAPLVRPGVNRLEIDVVNTWNNRLVGGARGAPEARITRTNLARSFGAASPLLPSGLLGPVNLKFPVRTESRLR